MAGNAIGAYRGAAGAVELVSADRLLESGTQPLLNTVRDDVRCSDEPGSGESRNDILYLR
jgi:hypothetical protein